MKKYFIHNPFFRLFAPAVYGILIYLLILLINNQVLHVEEFFNEQEVYICIGLTYLSFESIRIVIVILDKFLKGRYVLLRIPIQFTLTTIISTITVMIGLTLYFAYYIGFSMSNTQLIGFTVIYALTALLYNFLYYSND